MPAPGGPVGPGGSGATGGSSGPVGAGGPRPLAAEADRERLLALLREHYATGLLGHEDLDRRVGMVLAGAAAVPSTTAGQSKPRRVRRGHAHADQPGAGWIPTDERFRDPTSRAIMRVWIDPADQTRHYVPEPGP
jgi:hypothetical protein